MREKSMQIPPRVAAKWPSRDVPPEYAVTGMRLSWQIFMTALTSRVLAGLTTQNGTSPGSAGCEDHEEPACDSSSLFSSVMLPFPTMSWKSMYAACRFASLMLCFGGMACSSGIVEFFSAGFWPACP
jgi:hypothetical protein